MRSYALLIPVQFEGYLNLRKHGVDPKPIDARAPRFNELNFQLSSNVMLLLEALEGYQIVNPDQEIFRVALNSAMFDIRNTFSPLFSELCKCLPMDVNPEDVGSIGVKVLSPPAPDDASLKRLKALIDEYLRCIDVLGEYVYDLRVDLQNTLLGSIFEKEVPLRKPLDPTRMVVSTQPDKLKQLEEYFVENTEWGKNKAQIERTVIESLSDR